MKVMRTQALVAPNVWAKVPVLEISVDLAELQSRSQGLAACFQQLGEWLPGLASRHALQEMVEAGEDGCCTVAAAFGQSLAAVTLELQELAYKPVFFARATVTAPAVCRLAVEFQEEALGRACFEAACRFCLAAIYGDDLDVAAEISRLESLADDVCLGQATGPIVAAAQARGIPVRRLNEVSLVQLGHGSAQQRIQTSLTDHTRKISESIAIDKELTKRLLHEIGVPVPVGRVVASPDDAWHAATELGLPVAIKPASADYGQGIGLNLKTREQVVDAFVAAREYREKVLVERFAPGAQHRITVVGPRVVAAVRRDPPRLVGDGRLTISQLIDEANRDPRRGESPKILLSPICEDNDTAAVLGEQGLTLDSVLPAGREVVTSRIGHLWAGAGVVDVTDAVHPHIAEQCVAAARLVGLDVAGLDVIAEDISRPLEEQAGVVLEVNAEPTIAFHFPPLGERFRPVCEAIVESLFPDGETGRIPLIVVTGLEDNPEIGRSLTGLLKAAGWWTSRASAEGLFLNARKAKSADHSDLAGSRAALVSPQVEVAVLERRLASIRNEGLGVDQCHVAVITRLTPGEHPDDSSLDRELERAVRLLIESTVSSGAVVMDADDWVAGKITECVRDSTILVSTQSAGSWHPKPNQRGMRAVYQRGCDVVLASRDGSEQIVTLDDRLQPRSVNGNQDGLLMAVASLWGLGVPVGRICKAYEPANATLTVANR